MIDPHPLSRAIVDATRLAQDPTVEQRARNRAALARRLGQGALVATVASTAATASGTAASTASLASGVAAKMLSATLFWGVVGAGAGATLLVATQAPQQPSIASVSRPVAPVSPIDSNLSAPLPSSARRAPEGPPSQPEAPLASAAPERAPMPSAPAAPLRAPALTPAPSPGIGALPSSSTTSLQEELAILEQAERALHAGDPSAALETLDGAAARTASGSMLEERRALRIIALCALATPEADLRATEFLDHFPNSPLATRVRSACRR